MRTHFPGCPAAPNVPADQRAASRAALAIMGFALVSMLTGCVTLDDDDYGYGRARSTGAVWGPPPPTYWGPPPREREGWGRPNYVRNGRCDDERYQTSNGGSAPPGGDEHDCLLYGNGLKSGRVKNEGEFARDGVCDDPRFFQTTGKGRPGYDDYDCSRVGGGLRRR